MEIRELNINGVFEIRLNPIFDNRGFFMRTYDIQIFEKYGINFNWMQENHSKTLMKNTIRGLHFQLPPFAETKLIRCIRGEILDVFVDLRKGSSTFGQWGVVELSEDKYNMVLIPKGFAHGFCTLTENCEVLYKVDNYYSKEHEIGLLWNDQDFNIDWPTKLPILSEKDKNNISFNQFKLTYKHIEI